MARPLQPRVSLPPTTGSTEFSGKLLITHLVSFTCTSHSARRCLWLSAPIKNQKKVAPSVICLLTYSTAFYPDILLRTLLSSTLHVYSFRLRVGSPQLYVKLWITVLYCVGVWIWQKKNEHSVQCHVFSGFHHIFGAFVKLRNATISFAMFVRPSFLPFAWYNSSPTEGIFMKFGTWGYFQNLLRKINFRWNQKRKNGTSHEDQYTFFITSRSFILGMRNVSEKFCREN